MARSSTRATRAQQTPKTTRPSARMRRAAVTKSPGERMGGRRLDALPDRVDLRDWLYRPSLDPLPARLVNCAKVPEILDQGREGACTGFALAAVVQFGLGRRGRGRVSPRMLYEMARRYDEWPGEDYEGSSARGGMKGWTAHGVCTRASWPDTLKGIAQATEARMAEARGIPGGAYYRVRHRNVRDMHGALADAGILYVTLMVHDGWSDPDGPSRRVAPGWTLPTIQRSGKADSGHAVAFVGYTDEGFIVQNSWGESWGEGGFALLPYEDYLIHATDVWVAQVGVPITIDLWQQSGSTTAGLHRAAPSIPLADIRPYVVNAGNNGKLSDSGTYWTTEADVERLFNETIPEKTRGWDTQRVLLYLHGGLNSEAEAATRIVAFRDVCLENQIYPLHVMWETGAMDTLRGIIRDAFGVDDRSGGPREWLRDFRNNLVEAKDRTFELTVSRPGTAMWGEMKENARGASHNAAQNGVMQLLVKHARKALAKLPAAGRKRWELHVIGHSAGSIYAAYALEQLVSLGLNFKSLSFMAPALTVADFKRLVAPHLDGRAAPQPSLFILSDQGERDDDVGPYGKSLLYLVSNAFEGAFDTPLLGMQPYVQQLEGRKGPDPEVARIFTREVDGRPSLVIAGSGPRSPSIDDCNAGISRSETHGGFDNDEATLNSILWRILGSKPVRPFTMRDLQY
jgi:hypothetical protein